ncbi:L-lactate permease [Rhizobium sp. BR 314]|uniref:L-lactate permease n=1 Tax=Rhizobium sp. BR 314 TaxID=3040013 RepID=UPI0039BFB248
MLGNMMAASDMAAFLAKALAGAGMAYLAAAPFVGAVGRIVTGSIAGANAIFATTQSDIARSLGVNVCGSRPFTMCRHLSCLWRRRKRSKWWCVYPRQRPANIAAGPDDDFVRGHGHCCNTGNDQCRAPYHLRHREPAHWVHRSGPKPISDAERDLQLGLLNSASISPFVSPDDGTAGRKQS